MTGAPTLEAVMHQLGARRHEPLARHTFVQVGGPADWFVSVRDRTDLVDAVRVSRDADEPITVLGAGSNVLIRNGGLRGVAIKNESKACRLLSETQIDVDSGARFAALARSTARAGLSGLEWAAGIPGAIGGGLPTNAGAYGAELSDVLVGVSAIAPDGQLVELSRDELALGYRQSALRDGPLFGHIVTSVKLQLRRGDVDESLAEIDRVESLRKANAPSGPSLGSTFKNPIDDPRSAGQLIDAAGLKGERIGAAQVSMLHANYILNVDVAHATATDFLSLISRIQDRVEDRFAVRLEPEIAVIGEEARLDD